MSYDAASLTPIRRQYLELKAKHPGAILFFRLGDFYETFDNDAEIVARELNIALTSRPMGKQGRVPLAGVPYHALDSYLAQLINHGYRVAICEQLADPKDVKGIVPRGVVRVVSPGTVTEPALLDGARNNYLAAYLPPPTARRRADRRASWAPGNAGLAYIDITTSEFVTAEMPESRAIAELERLAPSELLVPRSTQGREAKQTLCPASLLTENKNTNGAAVTEVDTEWFEPEAGRAALQEHFGVVSLEPYECQQLPAAIGAAGAVLEYLRQNQPSVLSQVTRLATQNPDGWMHLDRQTRRNLELFSRAREGTEVGSLFSVLNLTRSAMGARLLRQWIDRPLLECTPLEGRLDSVQWLVDHPTARGRLLEIMGKMPDLERLVNRARGGRAGPRDLLALRRGLALLPQIHAVAEGCPGGLDRETLTPLQEVAGLLTSAIKEDAPASLEDGQVIRPGFSPELDGLRERVRAGQEAVLSLERREQQRTGIKSLKVGYNKVFGYYLEVSNAHRRLVPEDYMRKQTLVGGERFFTAELKAQETGLLAAQDRIAEVERELFLGVCQRVGERGEQVLTASAEVAYLDTVAALAEAAARYRYVRPALDCGSGIAIEEGRHPVVERLLADQPFVPNDTNLWGGEDPRPASIPCQIAVVTGPNMSGKSTYLRQVALIVLMAQIGSFVPARSARIGVVDRIFSRVGAQDDLATGQSTFMVEMTETAQILHHASSRSLVILDELGRGTSTYDGISIAQAVLEYLHQDPSRAPRTLFATHYHELMALSQHLPRVKNFTFAVTQAPGSSAGRTRGETPDLVFLRRLVPGAADQSYGVQVARLAGLPSTVTGRAEELLRGMEARPAALARRNAPGVQMPLWNGHGEVVAELRALDLNGMTPIEALTVLYQLQGKVRSEESRKGGVRGDR